MFMRYEDGLGFQKKLRHSASWRCGFSHQMKCQLNNNVFFFKEFAFPVVPPRKIPPIPCCCSTEVASWVPSTSPEMGKPRASTGTLILCLCQIWWSWWDPVENLQPPDIRGVLTTWEVWWAQFWVSFFFSGEIEGFSVVSGESRGFFDEQHASKWFVSLLPLAWIVEITNRSRVKRSLKIPQHLPLTFRHFELLRLDCSPFRSEFVSANFFAWGKDTRHRKLQVVVRDSRLVATLGTFEI